MAERAEYWRPQGEPYAGGTALTGEQVTECTLPYETISTLTLLVNWRELQPIHEQRSEHLPRLRNVSRQQALHVRDSRPELLLDAPSVEGRDALPTEEIIEFLGKRLLPFLLDLECSQERIERFATRDGVSETALAGLDQEEFPLNGGAAIQLMLLPPSQPLQRLVDGRFDDTLVQDFSDRRQDGLIEEVLLDLNGVRADGRSTLVVVGAA